MCPQMASCRTLLPTYVSKIDVVRENNPMQVDGKGKKHISQTYTHTLPLHLPTQAALMVLQDPNFDNSQSLHTLLV